jgi:hypothetical protein
MLYYRMGGFFLATVFAFSEHLTGPGQTMRGCDPMDASFGYPPEFEPVSMPSEKVERQ